METYTCSPLAANSRIRDAYHANRMTIDTAAGLFCFALLFGGLVATLYNFVVEYNL